MELADNCSHFLVVILLPPYQVTHILYVQSDQFLHCIPFVLTITLGLRKFTKFNPSTCMSLQKSGEQPESMTSKDAAMFPIIASCTLLGLYIFFKVSVRVLFCTKKS